MLSMLGKEVCFCARNSYAAFMSGLGKLRLHMQCATFQPQLDLCLKREWICRVSLRACTGLLHAM